MKCPFCNSENLKPLRGDWLRCQDCSLGFKSSGYRPEDISVGPVYAKSVWDNALSALNNHALSQLEKLLYFKGTLLDIGCGH